MKKYYYLLALCMLISLSVFSQQRAAKTHINSLSKKGKMVCLKEQRKYEKYKIIFTKDIIRKLNDANNDTSNIKCINIIPDEDAKDYELKYHCGNWVNFELFNDYKKNETGVPSFLNFKYTFINDLPKEKECKAIINYLNLKQYKKRINFVYNKKIYCYYDGTRDTLFYHKEMNLNIDTLRIDYACSKPEFYHSFVISTDTITGGMAKFDINAFADFRLYFRQIRDYCFIDSVFKIEKEFGDLLIKYQKVSYPLAREDFAKIFNKSLEGTHSPTEALVSGKKIYFISEKFCDNNIAFSVFNSLKKYMYNYRFSEAKFYPSLTSTPYVYKINDLLDESLEDSSTY